MGLALAFPAHLRRSLSGRTITMTLTVACLLLLVGLPLLFVVLQVVFPEITRGSLAAPFSLLIPTLSDPDLLQLTFNTLRLGLAVVAVCALVAIPLGALRALTRVPGAAFWD